MLLSLIAACALHAPAEIPITTALGISGVTQGGRVPAPVDLVQARIVAGTWTTPKSGDKMPGARGNEVSWTEMQANKDGVFEGPATRGGYVMATYDSPADKPMILQATGDSLVYINGVPRGGDPYGYGYLQIPFPMKKGTNEFLFVCGRGQLSAKLMEPSRNGVAFNSGDLTLPDVMTDKDEDLIGAIPIVNCSPMRHAKIKISILQDGRSIGSSSVPAMEPFSIRKVPFTFHPKALPEGGEIELNLHLSEQQSDMIVTDDDVTIKVRVRKPTEHYKRTFISKIDGSVQYYAVAPALKPSPENALILTVHGASVEALNQAQAYKPKDWCNIVAATNRRPFGFDWEDWGRMDAMEVLELAKKEFSHDPKRVILTGHSMGGHGTWQLGLTYPNEFAAIGPSAGWISFWSYAGGWQPRDPNPVEQILFRSTAQSDTLKMLPNALGEDLYILHGDKDDNVPVEQARTMKAELEKIGAKFEYHEQPGAGHWWGDQCVDWPPMFDLFQKARLNPGDHWKFTTINPAVSSTYGGVTIQAQITPMKPSSVEATRNGDGTWSLKTDNVAWLTLDTKQVDPMPQITLDGVEIKTASGDGRAVLQSLIHNGSAWVPDVDGKSLRKTSDRSGPFKLAFQNHMVFVVGTRGTKAENDWAMNKARFDAEQWYYRGNGAVDIVEDKDAGRYKERNLVLYGNSDTNSAFRLLSKCPVQVNRKQVSVGPETFKGDGLAAVYLYPEGSRLIAVVAGTGMAGLRTTDRMPYFTSGVAYPDWAVFGPRALTEGSKGAVAAGFFSNGWTYDPANSAISK